MAAGKQGLDFQHFVALQQIQQDRHHTVPAEEGREGDAQPADGRVGMAGEACFGACQLVQRALAAVAEGPAGIGERQFACGALEQAYLQAFLQPGDGLADRGFGEAELAGRHAEAFGFGRLQEGPDGMKSLARNHAANLAK